MCHQDSNSVLSLLAVCQEHKSLAIQIITISLVVNLSLFKGQAIFLIPYNSLHQNAILGKPQVSWPWISAEERFPSMYIWNLVLHKTIRGIASLQSRVLEDDQLKVILSYEMGWRLAQSMRLYLKRKGERSEEEEEKER